MKKAELVTAILAILRQDRMAEWWRLNEIYKLVAKENGNA